ncbi:hypothetical protein AAG747_06385 [Rapidithrix thailandica]|uniref:Uncharacterized protein n=1 Tax=Rapidithrix thailandica TaxID=413964 RepID=A0AAW9S9E0_9BACT
MEPVNYLIYEDIEWQRAEVLGISCVEGAYDVYIAKRTSQKVYIRKLTFDFHSESVALLPEYYVLPELKLIQGFHRDGEFYLIGVVNGSSKIQVYRFHEKGYQMIPFDLSGHSFNPETSISSSQTLDYNLEKIGRNWLPYKAALIYEGQVADPHLAKAKSKVYVANHEVSLVLNYLKGMTIVVTLDLESQVYEYRKYVMPPVSSGISKGNAFVYNGFLYQLITSNKQLWLTVTEMATNQIVTRLTASGKKQIPFKNQRVREKAEPIINGLGLKPYKEKKADVFIKMVRKMKLFISAYPRQDGTIGIAVGGIKTRKKRKDNRVAVPVTNPVSLASAGSVEFYGALGVGVGNVIDVTYDDFLYFNTVLDQEWKHDKAAVPQPAFQQFYQYFQKYDQLDLTTSMYFQANQKYYYGVYDLREKVYTVFEAKE